MRTPSVGFLRPLRWESPLQEFRGSCWTYSDPYDAHKTVMLLDRFIRLIPVQGMMGASPIHIDLIRKFLGLECCNLHIPSFLPVQ